MTFQALQVDRSATGVMTVRMNRPDRLNALDRVMVAELHQVFAEAAAAPPRALVLTGAGRGFCAGADLLDWPFDASADRGRAVAESMQQHFNPMVAAYYDLACPKIAAVNGVAAGGGANLALLADIVVAGHSASFVQVFGPRLGLAPDLGGTWLLPRLVGRARALGLALLGDKLDARAAAEWGLIWRAVPDAELMTVVSALAEQLAKGPRQAFAAITKAIDGGLDRDLPAQLDVERELQGRLAGHPDFGEAVAAFAAKREPRFSG